MNFKIITINVIAGSETAHFTAMVNHDFLIANVMQNNCAIDNYV